MDKKCTFAEKALKFNDWLSQVSFDLPVGFKIINPFNGEKKNLIKEVTYKFYHKFYNDTSPRRLILGSSPARRGSAITGIPFEDAKHLQEETGISFVNFHINQASSNFLYDVMSEYGGSKNFYKDFYMNFICPIGIVKKNSKGNEVNCNYYDNKIVQQILYDFMAETIYNQINLGIDTSICYCIGSGENFRFLSKLNEKYLFFDKIIPLEHPRFIMQYNSKSKEEYVKKYIIALRNSDSF